MEQLTGLRTQKWRPSYKTSAVIDGRPVDILHDFYLPALQRCVRYDRVAGYFRSTSLALASRGFSAFVGAQGKMRLVVGCDLKPDDVDVILQAKEGAPQEAEAYLSEVLGAELTGAGAWPEGVQNGVALLSWMLARGHLDIKVAFRVHSSTGKPLAVTSTEDGYMHEKWAIFTDEHGNRITGEGSWNESETALALNAENLTVRCDWWGERDRMEVDGNCETFEAIWNNQSPALRVMELPNAVRERLISFSAGLRKPKEIDGTSAMTESVAAEPSTLERLRWHVIKDAPLMPGGRFVGMTTAPIAPWPHQEVVARRLITNYPYHFLLCDEVGLGKTIEAGLALRSLHLSGLAKRMLVAAPASLTEQWQRELADKFLLGCTRLTSSRLYDLYPDERDRVADDLFACDRAIISTGLLCRPERLSQLKGAQPYDIVLVDEAHYARRKEPTKGERSHLRPGQLYKALDEVLKPKSDALWLATATPMQLHAIEVADLLRLTDRVGAFQFDPSLVRAYYAAMGKLVREESPDSDEWELLRQALLSLEHTDKLLWDYLQKVVMSGPVRGAAMGWLRSGRAPLSKPQRRQLLPLLFAAAPLSRVMLRHTRDLLKVYRAKGKLQANLANRTVLPLRPLSFTDQERAAYDQLEHYCTELAKQIQKAKEKKVRQAYGFLLCFLRLRFASSLYAIKSTLGRRRGKVLAALKQISAGEALPEGFDWEELFDGDSEDEADEEAILRLVETRSPDDLAWEIERLDEMLETLADLSGKSSKMTELHEVLGKRRDRNTGRIKQTVVFTRFYDTLTDIVGRLRSLDLHMRVGTYSGKGGDYYDPETGTLVHTERREEIKRRFIRGEIDVLVCTDAAAEGLNLQTSDLLINFDLPWNPMKVEQRIGRIDRIGQKHNDINVLNLCYQGSVEEAVYSRLLERLKNAGLVVGAQATSMLPVSSEEFRKLANHELTVDDLEQLSRERLALRQRQEQSIHIPADDLFSIYVRLSEEFSKQPVPLTLKHLHHAIVDSEYLHELGLEKAPDVDCSWFRVKGLYPGEPANGFLLTAHRSVRDAGVEGDPSTPYFASYGDPVFDAIVEKITSFELPGCCKRIAIPVDKLGATFVSYLVAVKTPTGGTDLKLVQGFEDLDGIALDETREITDQEIEAITGQVRQHARQEYEAMEAADRVERINLGWAHAQAALDAMVAGDLIRFRLEKDGADAIFWHALAEIDKLTEERSTLTVNLHPLEALRKIHGLLLCREEVTVPTMDAENSGRMYAPRYLTTGATDFAAAIADGMGGKRNELLLDRVAQRLEDRINHHLRQIKVS